MAIFNWSKFCKTKISIKKILKDFIFITFLNDVKKKYNKDVKSITSDI